jgi:hypothetical protein
VLIGSNEIGGAYHTGSFSMVRGGTPSAEYQNMLELAKKLSIEAKAKYQAMIKSNEDQYRKNQLEGKKIAEQNAQRAKERQARYVAFRKNVKPGDVVVTGMYERGLVIEVRGQLVKVQTNRGEAWQRRSDLTPGN